MFDSGLCQVRHGSSIHLPGCLPALGGLGAVHIGIGSGIKDSFYAVPVVAFYRRAVGYIKLGGVGSASLWVRFLQSPAKLTVGADYQNTLHVPKVSFNEGLLRSLSAMIIPWPSGSGQAMFKSGSSGLQATPGIVGIHS